MKLPKLPTECLRRALGPNLTYIPKLDMTLPPDTLVAGLLLSEFDTDTYSPEELLKLNVLKPIMQGAAYVYTKVELDEEVIKFFDSIKNSSPAVIYFVRGVYAADDRPLDKSKVKQHILDTLIGRAWRDSNFYIWGRPEPPGSITASTLSYDIKQMITTYFKTKYKRDPSIETLLSEGLCIFDKLPEDRLVKFFDALRRLMPYIRYLHIPTKYRRHHEFLVYDKHTSNLYTYDLANFPIPLPTQDVSECGMRARWTIKGKKLVINKIFHLRFYKWAKEEHVKKFIIQFCSKYPKQSEASTIVRECECDIQWKKTELYELPEDLQELSDIWQELL